MKNILQNMSLFFFLENWSTSRPRNYPFSGLFFFSYIFLSRGGFVFSFRMLVGNNSHNVPGGSKSTGKPVTSKVGLYSSTRLSTPALKKLLSIT